MKWGGNNFASFPWRATRNLWHALVAEIMLQRTSALQVLPVYIQFSSRFPSPDSYLANDGYKVFAQLGLHWREAMLRPLAESLVINGFPRNREALESLPGVGDYIASAMLSLHMNVRATIIDANVVRLLGRAWGFEWDGETRRKQWLRRIADTLTPARDFRSYNYAVLDLTRAVCTKTPKCLQCPLRRLCHYATAVD